MLPPVICKGVAEILCCSGCSTVSDQGELKQAEVTRLLQVIHLWSLAIIPFLPTFFWISPDFLLLVLALLATACSWLSQRAGFVLCVCACLIPGHPLRFQLMSFQPCSFVSAVVLVLMLLPVLCYLFPVPCFLEQQHSCFGFSLLTLQLLLYQ